MIYGFLSTILFILILPFLFIFNILKLKLGNGLKQKLGFNRKVTLNNSIVFYGVSVGEVLAIQNLIMETKKQFPDNSIVVTTGTKTGQEIAKKNLGNIVDFITYFPFDIPFCINKFIDTVDPSVVIIAETELWPNFAYCMKKKNIPLMIVNGRMSDRTYGSYKKLSFFFAPILKKYTKILTQSESDNNKLISIGANEDTTKIMGNLKFDIEAKNIEGNLIEKNADDKIIIAASTHSGEDEIILEAFKKVRKSNIKLLIAPRHPERNDAVYDLCENTGLNVGRRSTNDNFIDNEIILLDTMGELGKMYSICYFAFIGGSFNKTGGHNPLEASIYNKPVISGPCYHNFKDIYAIITRCDAGKIVNTKEELIEQMNLLLSDDNYYKKACEDCKKVFEQNKGALNRAINEIKVILN